MIEETEKIKGRIKCPIYADSEIVVFQGAKGRVSIICPMCNRVGIYDLEYMKAYKGKAISSHIKRG